MSDQQLLTARHLLGRALGAIEFCREQYAPISSCLPQLCDEIKAYLWPEESESIRTPTLDTCGTVEGHETELGAYRICEDGGA